MMVLIKQLINTGILNHEWVGFQGDSEFIDSNGKLQLGYWNFISISEEKTDANHSLDCEIREEYIYGGNCTLNILNEKGHLCKVGLHYIHSDCKNCKHDYQSYHCMGCNSYYGSEDDLDPFCNYCNHTPYEDACENCVWNFGDDEND